MNTIPHTVHNVCSGDDSMFVRVDAPHLDPRVGVDVRQSRLGTSISPGRVRSCARSRDVDHSV